MNNENFGILYSGYDGGVARGNECSGNGFHGIAVAGQSQPTLEGNICEDNESAGIAYSDEGGGVAKSNECSWNWLGIYVEVTANPELLDNDCHDNIEEDIVDER